MGGAYYKDFDHGWSEFFGSQNIYFNIKARRGVFHVLFNHRLKIYLSLLVVWIILLYLFIYFNSLF